jgi:large subunit ribosomal protein L24
MTKSKQPRKQRRALYNMALHQKRKTISSHLCEELLMKYNRRSMQVKKGDTVKIVRGKFKGRVEKIADVDVKSRKIIIENINITKADGKQAPRPIDPSKVIVMKLDLTDPWRRERLGATGGKE